MSRATRISLIIVATAVVLSLVVPSLRDLLVGAPAFVRHGALPDGDLAFHVGTYEELRDCAEREGAERPELLLGAGVFAQGPVSRPSPEGEPGEGEAISAAGKELVRRAAESGGYAPAWATHTANLFHGIEYPNAVNVCSLGDPETVAEVEERIGMVRAGMEVDEATAALLLEALRAWQEADPENGLPVALEGQVLYGSGRESEGLARWREAGGYSKVTSYWRETRGAVVAVLERTYVPRVEAESASWNVLPVYMSQLYEELLKGGRIGRYEAMRADMEGRTEEAAALWGATYRLGAALEESAKTVLGYSFAVNMERLGTRPDAGPGEGPEVAEARQELLRKDMLAVATALLTRMMLGTLLLREFIVLALSTVAVVMVFGVVSAWGRRRADEATGIGRGWVIAIIALTPILGIALFIGASYGVHALGGSTLAISPWMAWGRVAGLVVAAGMLALLGAWRRRRKPAGVWTAWRGTVRATFPSLAAAMVIGCLGMGFVAGPMRAEVTRELARTELERMIEEIGPSWAEAGASREAGDAGPASDGE